MKKAILPLVVLFFSLGLLFGQSIIKEPIPLTKAEFLKKVANYETNPNEWIYLGKLPAIVEFSASWCPPCKTLAPIYKELAAEYAGKILFYTVDTDKEEELTSAFGIESIPTLLLIPQEGMPQIIIGAPSKADLIKAINQVILKKKE